MIVVIGLGITANAQDVITLKNGTDINALVQKISEIEIEYKKFDNLNGPNYTLKKSEILMIRYENGTKDIFSEESKPIERKEISTLEPNDRGIETITIPENALNKKDVIVRLGGFGFQTKITHIDKEFAFRLALPMTEK